MANSYDAGRLDLPFVGICTFGKYPVCLDWEGIAADVAVLGAPFGMGTQWRSGARSGPRAIREASTLFAFGHAGAYDHEDDATYYYRVMNYWMQAAARRPAGSRGIGAAGASARRRGAGARSRSRAGCAARGAPEEPRGR